MKVTLVWHDPPASLSSGTQLVNDLDLTVHANSLNGHGLLGNGVKDRLNNVEQVSSCTADVLWRHLYASLVLRIKCLCVHKVVSLAQSFAPFLLL